MKKLHFLAIIILLSLMITVPASAEIKRSYDQFDNTFTINSERVVHLDSKMDIVGTFSKMYTPKKQFPTYSLTIAFIGDRYYFLSRDFSYIIEGQDKGDSEQWTFGNDSFPNKPVVSSYKTLVLLDYSPILKAIKTGNTMEIKLKFDNYPPMILPISAEAIKEWQEVVSFDLATELKKQEDAKKQSNP